VGKKSILIVDSSDTNHCLLTSLLQEKGVGVSVARNGGEAMERARASPPDLIVSDILMPAMDGCFLFQKWKGDKTLRQILFLFYTAAQSEPPEDAFIPDSGADGFILNPREPARLIERILELLEKSSPTAPDDSRLPDGAMEFLRGHNELLFGKLAQKMADLEAARRRLQSLEEQYRLIFENVTDIVWTIDTDLCISWMSPGIERMLGYRSRDLIGKPLKDLIGHLAPGSIERAMAEIRAVFEGQTIPAAVYAFTARDGTIRYGEISGAPIRDHERIVGMVAVTRDITDKRKLEQDYEILFREMLDGFALHEILCDTRGRPVDYRFLAVNPAFERITGLKAEQILGRTILEILPETEPYWIEAFGRVALTGEPAFFESYAKTMDKHFEVKAFQPEPNRFACIFADITERKLAGEILRKVNEELELRVRERTAQIQAVNRELEAFSYSVSHDLRAPLRSIDGFSRAFQEDFGDRLDETARSYLERIRNATKRMGHLIDDLLKLARLTRKDMRRERVDLTSLARQVMEALHEFEPGRDVETVLQEGIWVEGDPDLLQVLLENLLGNAWKFTAKQAHPRIVLGLVEGGIPKTCFVRDNGVGFDMAYVKRLFGPFQRLHTQEEFPGTGIGLATVQRILSRHGGRIWAEGEPGVGATFYFTWP